MFLQKAAFWLFWLTFVNMNHNQLNFNAGNGSPNNSDNSQHTESSAGSTTHGQSDNRVTSSTNKDFNYVHSTSNGCLGAALPRNPMKREASNTRLHHHAHYHYQQTHNLQQNNQESDDEGDGAADSSEAAAHFESITLHDFDEVGKSFEDSNYYQQYGGNEPLHQHPEQQENELEEEKSLKPQMERAKAKAMATAKQLRANGAAAAVALRHAIINFPVSGEIYKDNDDGDDDDYEEDEISGQNKRKNASNTVGGATPNHNVATDNSTEASAPVIADHTFSNEHFEDTGGGKGDDVGGNGDDIGFGQSISGPNSAASFHRPNNAATSNSSNVIDVNGSPAMTFDFNSQTTSKPIKDAISTNKQSKQSSKAKRKSASTHRLSSENDFSFDFIEKIEKLLAKSDYKTATSEINNKGNSNDNLEGNGGNDSAKSHELIVSSTEATAAQIKKHQEPRVVATTTTTVTTQSTNVSTPTHFPERRHVYQSHQLYHGHQQQQQQQTPVMPEKLQYTKEINIKQGLLMGIVRTFQASTGLRDVDQYLGLPYAEAPTDSRRFMPPGTPLPWSGLKIARHLPPVCPQKLQELSVQESAKISRGRYKYLTRLLPYLKNESEDCLYLNVYVPREDASVHPQQLYPVIVYIHGESFEWNSGNAYDGSVLASYGQVIVVTVNYRLGLMGFMRPGISDATIANFGLLDQIAALHWIKENIAAFNGDKDKVTLMGHSTGAACINYLMISPVAAGLFHRAILMSGSAMSDWAASNHSLQLTMQIAHSLDCPLNDDNEQMLQCLRQKRYQELLKVPLQIPQFTVALGPIVDGHVIPDQPYKAMSQYTELFSRYDLLFGITESESYHTLGALALEEGLRENERDNLLRFYMQSRFDVRPDLALAATLKKYNDMYNNPLRATNLEHRDVVLDILSDARIVGPLMQTGLFHADVNRQSFMYVFGHNSAAGPYASLPHSIAGEELAFVFGAPLAPAGLFHGNNYSVQEKLLSEAVMSYWTNFAKTGNPKAPWKGIFTNLHTMEWDRYDLDWPLFNKRTQAYMNIGIPPSIGYKYRQIYMNFWNKELPDELNQIAAIQQQPYVHGQYQQQVNGNNADSVYPTRRSSIANEIITGHMNKYGTRDNGAEDPVRTLKLLLQEASAGSVNNGGNTIAEAENMYNAPPTFGVTKHNVEDEASYGSVKHTILSNYDNNNNGYISANSGNSIIYATTTANGIEGFASEGDKEEANNVAKSEMTIQLLIGLIIVFIVLNVVIYSTFILQKKRKKATALGINRKLGGILSYDGNTEDELKRSKQTTQPDGDDSYILDVVRKSNMYEAVRTVERSPINGYKMTRQLSTSTVDTHTKVSEWISGNAREQGKIFVGTLLRIPRELKKSESPEFSTLRGSSGAGSFSRPTRRVSVAIDATSQNRGDSVLGQEPIEVTKLKTEGGKIIICQDVEVTDQELLTPQHSLDASDSLENRIPMLMRQDSAITAACEAELQQQNREFLGIQPIHQHSRSDPIDLYYCNVAPGDLKATSFITPESNTEDINVTSRDEPDDNALLSAMPLTPAQQLSLIKSRNYPKVLPSFKNIRATDSPPMTADLNTTGYKRNSLPPNSFVPQFLSGFRNAAPPMPPPRTISTLGRNGSMAAARNRRDSNDITTSPLQLASDYTLEENEQEAEITENTLIVGPLLPKANDGNYSTLRRKVNEPNQGGDDAENNSEPKCLAVNSAEVENEVEQKQKQQPTGRWIPTLRLTPLTAALSGAFQSFESAKHEMIQPADKSESKPNESVQITEKVYSIEAPKSVPSAQITLNSNRSTFDSGKAGDIYAQPNKLQTNKSSSTLAGLGAFKSNIPRISPAASTAPMGAIEALGKANTFSNATPNSTNESTQHNTASQQSTVTTACHKIPCNQNTATALNKTPSTKSLTNANQLAKLSDFSQSNITAAGGATPQTEKTTRIPQFNRFQQQPLQTTFNDSNKSDNNRSKENPTGNSEQNTTSTIPTTSKTIDIHSINNKTPNDISTNSSATANSKSARISSASSSASSEASSSASKASKFSAASSSSSTASSSSASSLSKTSSSSFVSDATHSSSSSISSLDTVRTELKQK